MKQTCRKFRNKNNICHIYISPKICISIWATQNLKRFINIQWSFNLRSSR